MPLIPLLFGGNSLLKSTLICNCKKLKYNLFHLGNRNYDIGNILFREISAGSLYLPDVMFLCGGILTSVIWLPVFEKTKGKISFFYFFNFTLVTYYTGHCGYTLNWFHLSKIWFGSIF